MEKIYWADVASTPQASRRPAALDRRLVWRLCVSRPETPFSHRCGVPTLPAASYRRRNDILSTNWRAGINKGWDQRDRNKCKRLLRWEVPTCRSMLVAARSQRVSLSGEQKLIRAWASTWRGWRRRHDVTSDATQDRSATTPTPDRPPAACGAPQAAASSETGLTKDEPLLLGWPMRHFRYDAQRK